MYRRDFLKNTFRFLGSLIFFQTVWPKDLKTGLNENQERNFSLLKRKIPVSGEEIPALGLGTRVGFDVLWDFYEELSYLLDLFFQKGGMVIDTSPAFGEAERTVGNLTYDVDYFLSTRIVSGKIENFTKSLALLRKSELKALFWEGPFSGETKKEALKLKEQGKIQYWGFCEMDEKNYDNLKGAMQKLKPDLILIPYNLIERKAETYILPLALELKIGVFVARPFAGGDLLLPSYPSKLAQEWENYSCQSRAQALIKFILSHEAVTCVLTGTKRVEHLKQNLLAASQPLPKSEERNYLAKLLL